MWTNYFKAFAGTFSEHPLSAALTVVSLAIGLATATFVFLFVRHESSYDTFIPGHESVYRITAINKPTGQRVSASAITSLQTAELLQLEFPEIQAATRLVVGDTYGVRHGEIFSTEKIYWADADTFEVLPLASVAGNAKIALQRPDQVVITRSIAAKFFGAENPLGKSLQLDGEHELYVSAVIDDIPTTTHLEARIFAASKSFFSIPSMLERGGFGKRSVALTYVRLKPGAAVSELQSRMPALIDKYQKGMGPKPSDVLEFDITPVTDIHLQLGRLGRLNSNGSWYIFYASTVIGSLILLIASVNFANAMTARSLDRSVEVGVRKTCGAKRTQIMAQFIAESLAYAGIGLAAALLLVGIFMPSFAAWLQWEAGLDDWLDLPLIGFLLATLVLVGIVGGAYPALILGRFRPATVLRSRTAQFGSGRWVSLSLIVLQFLIITLLISFVLVTYLQTKFALEQGVGLDREHVVVVETSRRKPCPEAFRAAVAQLSTVKAAACSFLAPFSNGIAAQVVSLTGTKFLLYQSPVDIDFFGVFGLEPIAGRVFDRARGSDYSELATEPDAIAQTPQTIAVVANVSAVRKFGFASPEAAIGQIVTWDRVTPPVPVVFKGQQAQIIGVVPDVPLGTVREEIQPTFFYVQPYVSRFISIKLTGQDVLGTIEQIDAAWQRVGHRGVLYERTFLDDRIERLYQGMIRQRNLFAIFAIVAIALGCLGLFGFAGIAVNQRAKEIGVRKAMGATRTDIARFITWQFLKPILFASLAGVALAFFAARLWLAQYAYRIDLGVWIPVLTLTLTFVIALVTVGGHVTRLSSLRPTDVLHDE